MLEARTETAPPPVSPRIWIAAVAVAGAACGLLSARAPMAALVLPPALFLTVLGLRRPLVIFAAFVFYGSVELTVVTRFNGNLYLAVRMASEVLLEVVSIGVILGCALRNGGLRRTPIDLPLLAFLGVSVISAAVNHVPLVPAFLGLRILFRFALVYYAIVQLRPRAGELRPLFLTLLVALAVQVAIGLLEAWRPREIKALFLTESKANIFGVQVRGGQTFRRIDIQSAIFGTMENYNNYGAFLALSLPLAYGYWWLRSGRPRIRLTLLLIGGMIALLLTGSRSSLIALVPAVLILFIQFKQRTALALFGVLAALGVLVVAISALQHQGMMAGNLPVYTNSFLHRWLLLLDPGMFQAKATTNFRLFLFARMALRTLLRAPLVGLGIGTFGSMYSIQAMTPMYRELGVATMLSHGFVADCNWLTIYVQTGLLGLFTFIAIFWSVARKAGAAARGATGSDPAIMAIYRGFVPFLAAYAVLTIFGPYFETRYLSFLLWSYMAVVTLGAESAAARAET